MNPVPGWIYLLPGQGTGFYRYAIPTSLPNVALDGIYPGQSAVIADLTPLMDDASLDPGTYIGSLISAFAQDVNDRIQRMSSAAA